MSLHVTNDTLFKVDGSMKWRLINGSTENVIMQNEKQGIVEPLTAIEFEKLDFSNVIDTDHKKRNSYLEFKFIEKDKIISSGIVMFVPIKHYDLKDPELEVNVREEPERFIISLKSKKLAKYIELDLTNTDGIFSDNYFDMSGGEAKEVYLKQGYTFRNISVDELRQELTLRSLYDSYEKF